MKSVFINVLGAPHSGKSTFATYLFSVMKTQGFRVSYIDEPVKKLAYLSPQLIRKENYSLALNYLKTVEWEGTTPYIVSESSPIVSCLYNSCCQNTGLILYEQFINLNVFLPTIEFIETEGRLENSYEECYALEQKFRRNLKDWQIDYIDLGLEDNSKRAELVIKTLKDKDFVL